VRLLCVHPGASYATGDVYNGLVDQLLLQGVEVYQYDLESRLTMSSEWLTFIWTRAGKPDPEPNTSDIAYGASKDIVERALRYNVDGVLIVSAMFVHPDVLHLLQRMPMPTATVLTESPYDDQFQERVTGLLDIVWTNERSSVERLRRTTPHVYYLPHSYDPAVHHPDWTQDEWDTPAHDVVFVGSYFTERQELLEAVDWTGIDFAIYGQWESLPKTSLLHQYIKGGIVNNRFAAALYRRAHIGINLYRESIGWGLDTPRITHAESLNPRAVELAACGLFQVSQPRDEVAEIFGESVGTFSTPAELEHVVRHYLANDEARERGATIARERVHGRTFAAAAASIVTTLREHGWPVQRRVCDSPQFPRTSALPRPDLATGETNTWLATTAGAAGSTPPSTAPAPLSLSPH
jgi:hypothetical protein